MSVTYEFAVDQLLLLGHELTSNRKFDLDHMRRLAATLGNPQRKFQSVLIAGTNGKGSTAATLASIARAAGYRTGLYTSPHLQRVNERMQINGELISDAEFAMIYDRVESAAGDLVARGELPWHPSFFEMLTAMTFEYFASAGVELAVLEVGMGGRLDATNIVDPCVSVITDIDFDHQKFLGSTLPEIAREKAGIMRANGTVVLLAQHPLVNDALGKEIMERGSRAVNAVEYMPSMAPDAGGDDRALSVHSGCNRFPLEVMGQEITVDFPLMGRHQLRNLALAIAAAEQLHDFGFGISAQQVEQGIRATRWPARFQVFPAEDGYPEVVIDVAHNPAGAWALRSALSAHYEDRPLTLVFGAMRDKAIAEIADILFPVAARVIATHAENPRAASPGEIVALGQHTQTDMMEESTVSAALERARLLTGANGVIVVAGSIYIAGEALAVLAQKPAGQGI